MRHSQPTTHCGRRCHCGFARFQPPFAHRRRRSRSPGGVAWLRTPGKVLNGCAPSGDRACRPAARPSDKVGLARSGAGRATAKPSKSRVVEGGDVHQAAQLQLDTPSRLRGAAPLYRFGHSRSLATALRRCARGFAVRGHPHLWLAPVNSTQARLPFRAGPAVPDEFAGIRTRIAGKSS